MDTIPDYQDDRTSEQRTTHHVLIGGKDKFLSSFGPGKARGSWAFWACRPCHADALWSWVEGRKDVRYMRQTRTMPPKVRGLMHVYVVDEGHPALAGGRK